MHLYKDLAWGAWLRAVRPVTVSHTEARSWARQLVAAHIYFIVGGVAEGMRYCTGKVVVSEPQEAADLSGAAWVVVLRASARASVMAVQVAKAGRQRARQLVSVQAFDVPKVMLDDVVGDDERLLHGTCKVNKRTHKNTHLIAGACITAQG